MWQRILDREVNMQQRMFMTLLVECTQSIRLHSAVRISPHFYSLLQLGACKGQSGGAPSAFLFYRQFRCGNQWNSSYKIFVCGIEGRDGLVCQRSNWFLNLGRGCSHCTSFQIHRVLVFHLPNSKGNSGVREEG